MTDAAPVRVGRIEFINCFPLYAHFEEELEARGVAAEVVSGHPAALNRMLAAGELDVALPSSIEFARHARDLTLLPRLSISGLGAVDSIQLFTRVPVEEVRSIALTEKSATTIVLLKALCVEWGIAPWFAPREGPLADALARFDGLLLIGDEAMHVLRAHVYPHHYDLGAVWRDVTGLPMVYAVLAARRDFVAARPGHAAAVEAALIASKDRCAAQPEVTAAQAALQYDFRAAFLLEYFDRLKYGFGEDYRRGLEEFYRRAAAIGELEQVPALDLGTPVVGPAGGA